LSKYVNVKKNLSRLKHGLLATNHTQKTTQLILQVHLLERTGCPDRILTVCAAPPPSVLMIQW